MDLVFMIGLTYDLLENLLCFYGRKILDIDSLGILSAD